MKMVIASLVIGLPVAAAGQATVEAAAGASRAATSVAAPGQQISKGIAGAVEKLNRTLQDTGQEKTSAKPQVVSPTVAERKSRPPISKARESTPAPEKVPEPQYEHPSGIREGMDLAEVSKRFGPPSLKISSGPDQETYCYVAKDGVSVDVTGSGGKVGSVQVKGDSGQDATATGRQK